MSKWVLWAGAGVLLIGLAVAAFAGNSRASCRRLLQTAELAAGAEVRFGPLGGCHIVAGSTAPVAAPVLAKPPIATPTRPIDRPDLPASLEGEARQTPSAAVAVITDQQIEAERSPDLARCLAEGDAARGVSVAMGGCVNVELQRQDARLNAVYREVMARLNETQRARLRTEERAWIRQRDDDCAAEATGGTIDLVDIPSCRLDETIHRRLTLESITP